MTEPTSEFTPPYPIVDPLECKACGRCIAFCPKKVLVMGSELNARGYIYTIYKGDGCIGCQNCYHVCPEPNAIKVVLPDRTQKK